MSYRQALGQAMRCPPGVSLSQCARSAPRGGIAGSGITNEMLLLGAAAVGVFVVAAVAYEAHERLWREAIPDADARAATRLGLSLAGF